MTEFINNLVANLIFIFERLNWLSVLDILLVTLIFLGILLLIRGTQGMVILRGVLFLIVFIGLLASLEVLPAFSWLVRTTLPALLFAIPVIFAPEIRHGLERLGRAGVFTSRDSLASEDMIGDIISAIVRLSDRQHGALIVMARQDSLEEYVQSGVRIEACVSPELILQIFYPNTPLHDGAIVISDHRVIGAACVMPLSASGVLDRSPDRQMGLRHRAAMGITEVSDAVALIVSEETGGISVVHSGRMIRRLDAERLENVLRAFFQPTEQRSFFQSVARLFFNRNRESTEGY